MTTLAHGSARRGPSNGGVAARRAVVRWAWRMFRREWRQQMLVVALLTVAVAAAIGSITLVYNTSPVFNGEFGSASGLLMFDGSDPQALGAALASANESSGTTDVIGHRQVPVPGGVETVDFRSQHPDGPYGGDLLALRSGSYPAGPGQVGLTEGVAELLNVELGATFDLDGRRRTVVGIVENPLDLGDEFARLPSSAGRRRTSPFLSTRADRSPRLRRLLAREWPFGPHGTEPARSRPPTRSHCSPSPPSSCSWPRSLPPRDSPSSRSVGSASSACSRRSGRLVAISGSCCTNGAVVGVIAAILGAIAGGALGHLRLDSRIRDGPSHRPAAQWTLLALVVLLAILSATAAAWPGRTVARLPTLLALSGRPPQPRSARHSAIRPRR